MKKIIITIALVFACISVNAQKEIKREGNTFSVVATKNTSKDNGEKTQFSWKDSKGNVYPVYKSKRGCYFIIRVSKNTGNEYKQYLPKDVQAEMKKADK